MRVIFSRKDVVEGRQPCSHRYWIRVVSSAVEDLVLRDQIHDGFVSTERRQRQTPTDRLGEADHVWYDAEIFRSPTPAEFRTGLDLIEDQQRALFRGDFAQSLQKSGLRHAQSDIHQNRFKDDGGYFSGILFETALDG